MDATPVISVCLITYNHAAFFKKAIEGVLAQKVTYSWELIVADDLSTDGTREIVLQYQKKYPERIRLILQEKNVGPARNFVELLGSAKGKYTAYLEGDDYWMDPLKLQKQVDFMESNPDCSICFHRIYDTYDGKTIRLVDLVPPNSIEKEKYSIEDLSVNNFIPSLSMVIRTGLIDKLPSWYESCPLGDYVLHMLNAKKGKIGFLPEAMGVYRRNQNSSWSMKSAKHQLINLMLTLDYLFQEFLEDAVISNNLKHQYAKYKAQLAELSLKEDDTEEYCKLLKEAFDISPKFMDDWLITVKGDYFKLEHSKEYKLGWALRHPGFMLKKYLLSAKTRR